MAVRLMLCQTGRVPVYMRLGKNNLLDSRNDRKFLEALENAVWVGGTRDHDSPRRSSERTEQQKGSASCSPFSMPRGPEDEQALLLIQFHPNYFILE